MRRAGWREVPPGRGRGSGVGRLELDFAGVDPLDPGKARLVRKFGDPDPRPSADFAVGRRHCIGFLVVRVVERKRTRGLKGVKIGDIPGCLEESGFEQGREVRRRLCERLRVGEERTTAGARKAEAHIIQT